MSKAALTFTKRLLQGTVEKFWMKAEHIGTCLNKVTNRFMFFPILAKGNQGTRSRDLFGRGSFASTHETLVPVEGVHPKKFR